MPHLSFKERVQTKSGLLILITENSIFHALLGSVYLRVTFDLSYTLLGSEYLRVILISCMPSWIVYT